MKKKLVAFISTLSLITLGSFIVPQVCAPLMSNANYEESTNIALSTYLDQQEDKYTNVIDRDVEKYLNEQGMFDSEIKNMSSEEIEQLNNVENPEDIQVAVEYYNYNEDTGEVSLATSDDISSFIINRDDVQQNKDFLLALGEKTGVIPSTAYASWQPTFSDTSEPVVTSDNMFKQTISITPYGNTFHNGQYTKPTTFCVHTTQTWMKAPKKREVDIYGMKIDGAHFAYSNDIPYEYYAYGVYYFDASDCHGKLFGKECTQVGTNYNGCSENIFKHNSCKREAKHYVTKKLNVIEENGSLMTRINLPNDGQQGKIASPYKFAKFTSFELHQYAFVRPENAYTTTIAAKAAYLHAEKEIHCDWQGVTISGGWSLTSDSVNNPLAGLNINANLTISEKTVWKPVPRNTARSAKAEIELNRPSYLN